MKKIEKGSIVRFKDKLNHLEIVGVGSGVENEYIVLDVVLDVWGDENDGEICRVLCSNGKQYYQTHEQWHNTYLFESISTPKEEEEE
jgi:hypothetical protein